MLFKKRSVRKGKAFETSMNIKERKAECNINQITAKSNDSEKSPDERMEWWRNAVECVRQKG